MFRVTRAGEALPNVTANLANNVSCCVRDKPEKCSVFEAVASTSKLPQLTSSRHSAVNKDRHEYDISEYRGIFLALTATEYDMEPWT